MKSPPFLVTYPDAGSLRSALNPNTINMYWAEIEHLIDLKLPPVVSVNVLAIIFGFSPRFVSSLAKKPERHYRTFTIPKGSRKRTIHAPRVGLKVIQKWIGYHLSSSVKVSDSVYGFISGRSAPMAAKKHVAAKWVYSVDIEDFFPSTPRDQITSALVELGYSKNGAALISNLCCYKDYLAQGSPASPVLSNIVFSPFDKAFEVIAEKYDIVYTRYADDIVFTGKGEVPVKLREEVCKIINTTCWKISKEKERLHKLPNRLKVHGLLVHGEKPRLTKGYRNKIRAYKHLLEHNKIEIEHVDKIRGHIAYASSIDKL